MYWIEFVINYFHQLKIKGRGTRGHDVGKYKHGEASPARSGGWVLLHLPTNKLTPHETLFSLFFCPTPHESIVFQTIHLFYFLNKYLLPSFYHTNTLQLYILNKITKTNLPPTLPPSFSNVIYVSCVVCIQVSNWTEFSSNERASKNRISNIISWNLDVGVWKWTMLFPWKHGCRLMLKMSNICWSPCPI